MGGYLRVDSIVQILGHPLVQAETDSLTILIRTDKRRSDLFSSNSRKNKGQAHVSVTSDRRLPRARYYFVGMPTL
jgi:hypothetical protein